MRKAVVGITLFLLAAPLVADEKLNDRMMHSASILQEIRGPLEEEPPGVLEDAYAVAIFPEFVKVGLFGGVKHGRGVLSTRLESGSWSRPAFVRITSGSVGLQFGVSMSQMLIVFKDPKAVEAISGGQITIGADAGYAAGELGGSATAGTDNKLENRIVMMARSKGLFAGVALEGGVLRTEKDSNVDFYNDAIGLDGRTLLEDEQVELPPVAQHFLIVLGESVPPVSPEATPANGEGESDVDLRFAEDENAETVAESAPGEPARKASRGSTGRSFIDPGNPSSRAIVNAQSPASGAQSGLSVNAAPEAGTWVTPATGSPQPSGGQSSGSGLGGKIAGKLADAAVDGAKDLAVDSIRNRPEVRGAKLAARAGSELASAVRPDPSPPLPKKRALPKPEAAIASTDGAWVTPGAPDYRIAGRSPGPLPSIPGAPDAEFTGPPAPSEWPDEWRDAQVLGGVCEPGT
ncbi:MAG: YSC84-related protein [Gammaproteobacteria bacterium]|nr:YSC84-related protein [Gammaproteobacteria bacterium]